MAKNISDIPFEVQTLPGEYVITVAFLLKEDTVWGKRGHEVAFGQGVYKVERAAQIPKGELEVVKSTHNIGIPWGRF